MMKNRISVNVTRKCITITSIFLVVNFLFLLNKSDFLGSPFHCTQNKIFRKIIQPPQLTNDEKQLLLSVNSSYNKTYLEKQLSNIVQNKIENIQTNANCSDRNFLCGHYDDCGFGCQVHHRVACLMMSFALNMPLIHDESDGWTKAYTRKWSNIFQPLGANCTPGPYTYRWNWRGYSIHRVKPCFIFSEVFDEIGYPLESGIPVPEELANLVQKIHPNPFLWWVGQFMKSALKPLENFEDGIKKDKQSIGFKSLIVGIHVRRTDKLAEYSESHHEIEEYMKHVESYFRNIEIAQQLQNQSLRRRVFIASDDSQVLSQAQNRYSKWDVIGFPSKDTLWNPYQRLNSLSEIVRDVLVLSECDYVICGLTSNVCRLVLEMLSYKYMNPEERLKSLDGAYEYIIQKHTMHRAAILKIK